MRIASKVKKFLIKLADIVRLTLKHGPLKSNYAGHLTIDRYRYRYFQFQYVFLGRNYKKHRNYFTADGRGFGEDAFHAAWREVFKTYRPAICLEIGVYRGQSISLWTMLQLDLKIDGVVSGLSPLTSSGDSVSNYPELDYFEDIYFNFEQFGLNSPNLIQGLSTDTVLKDTFLSDHYDLVYIDGDHEYQTVLNDYHFALSLLKQGGLICFDDSSLYFENEGKFKGHPGPSNVVVDFALKELKYLFTVGHLNFFQK